MVPYGTVWYLMVPYGTIVVPYEVVRFERPDQRRKLYRRRVGATRNHLGIHVGSILEPSWMGFGTHSDHVAAGKNRKQFYFGNKCSARKLENWSAK